MHQPLSQGLHNVFPFSGHCLMKACVQGKFAVFVFLIVPSRHMLWWSAEGALFWEMNVNLFWDAIHKGKFEKSAKKNVQCSRLEVSIHRVATPSC